MLDEEMDHIIRNAVDKHHPAYNDKAWEKMELKLDKHLPQNKDRRKFIFFLLFFLLLGGGAFFTIIHFTGDKTSVSRGFTENKNDKLLTVETVAQKDIPGNGDIKNYPDKNETEQITGNPGNNATNTIQQAGNGKNITENNIENKKSTVVRKGRSKMNKAVSNTSDESEVANKPETKINKLPVGKKFNTADKMNIIITAAEPENKESENITTVQAGLGKEKNTTDEQKSDTAKANGDITEKERAVPENKNSLSPDKKKSKKNGAGNFGVTLSAGPDLSFIQLNKLGKATLTYGAGLSYNFKKRITIRAGFYSSKKIYTATPDQYNAPIYPNLTEIYADCRVYEIPVSLSYNFWQRKNHNWFGSAGLSSFLMKNEYYNYQYKTPAGYTYNYKKEVRNENKHYFAVLTLSAGYQYQLSKQVSIQAEPYVKLPLSGIGLGKVKLNSSGILFTVTVKPFAKRK